MRKQFQFAIFFLQTFTSRHKKHIFLAGAIGFFVTLFLIQVYPLYAKTIGRRQQKIAVVGRFYENTLPLSIQSQISLGLTRITADGKVIPGLASSWEVDSNGTIYTFHLHPGLIFHDGKTFTASDINYRLRDATFDYVDKNTLKVTLKETYAPLLSLLSQPLIRPNLVGLGMYKAIRLRRSEDIIEELTLEPLDSRLPILSYRFYPNKNSAILAFKLGEVDILQNLPDTADLNQWKNINLKETVQYDRYVGVFLNLKDPFLKEKEVRQALSYAIPYTKDWQKVLTPISPLSWAYSQKIRLYEYDPDSAKKILARNPISSDSANLTLSTFPALLPTAQMMVDAWKKVGLEVKVKVENSLTDNFQMFLLTQIIPPDPDQYQYWQSTQEGTNITNYANPKIDKLLEDGRKTPDVEKRKKIYADFQRYLVDDAPVVFLYYPKVYTVERK